MVLTLSIFKTYLDLFFYYMQAINHLIKKQPIYYIILYNSVDWILKLKDK
jgi:hypothetical protein